MSRKHLSVVVLLGLGACASPPPVKTDHAPLEIPESFARTEEAAGGDTDSTWWTGFGEPSLNALVEEALEHNRDLEAAAANVRAAEAAATIAGADRWPQIAGSFQAARRQQVFVGLPIPGRDVLTSLSTSYGLSLDGSWEIDLWNRLGRQQQAAVAQLQATQADFAAARLSIAARTTDAWIDLNAAHTQLELAERTLEAFRQTESLAQERYRKGLIPSVELHLTRTSAEETAALLAARRLQVEAIGRQLEVLVGRYPGGALRGGALPTDLPPIPAAVPADLLLRRPDLVAAERRLVASGALVSQAKRNLLPRITLTGSSGRSSSALDDLLDGDFSVWSLAAGVVQPLFQGGRLRAIVKQNAAQEEVARAAYVQTALLAFAEVETAMAQEAHYEEREAHLRSALDSAQRAWELAEDRYRQGIGDLLSVLEAQRRALNTESQWIAVRAERRKNRVALHRALGGGFDLEAQTSVQASISPPPASE